MALSVDEQLREIQRGTVDIIPLEELKRKLETGKPLRVKLGADPSAPDLHFGHTVVLNKLRQFQQLGHTVIFLIGDFTGMIGDPTGRSETRKPLTREQIKANADTYTKQVFKILDPGKTEIRFNSEWMEALSSSDMIRLCSQYTVARLLERDDFAKRFRETIPIHVHELLYPLVQGYDSVALRADVEVGGTDQRFNLLVGRELQRSYGQEPQVILTMPLLEGTDGVQKMSKSLGNYIGITEAPTEIYGKVMSISDPIMVKYYELLSVVDNAHVEAIKRGDIHPMDAKQQLAAELVARFHGTAAANAAAADFVQRFQRRELPTELETFTWAGQEQTVWICHVMREAGLAKSTSEARRLITQGGVRLDGEKIEDADLRMTTQGEKILQVGRRRIMKVFFRPPATAS
ncbi:MAG: tyrosine--tRNA ligase [Deltaproteobacteria bacterium]|nr:tyrosine--tRNA ligase [Deltaproteobacteria bacterium]